MIRRIFLSVTIYPLVVVLFGLYFWGESRNLSQTVASGKTNVLRETEVWELVYSRTERVLLEGTPQETLIYIVTTPVEGPVVLVIGGVHGDEPAGYLAAEKISTWVVDRGTLIVIPRANVSAIQRQHRLGADQLDLNRSFPGRASGSPTQQLAAAIYGVKLEFEPDWVIDLHEALEFERLRPGALGQTIIYPYGFKSLDIIGELLAAVNRNIKLSNNHFLLRRGLVKGTVLETAVSVSAECIIVETCRQLPLDVRVDYQQRTVLSLLYLLGVTVY